MLSDSRGSVHIFGVIVLVGILIAVGAVTAIMVGYLRNAPNIDDVDVESRRSLPTIVYDANGEVITKLMVENRIWVKLRDIPEQLVQAVLAVEDHRFYEHHGISIRRILSALWQDIKSMSPEQGGSTITTQLARNVFLSHEKTIDRKIWEVLYAFQLERKYTKDEILEFYLNWIWMGHGAYGVAAAANIYFGKELSQCTLGELALIAGVAKGAGVYSPYVNMEASLSRRRVVLQRMVDVGYIDQDTANKAAQEPVNLVGLNREKDNTARYVSFMVRDYLLKRYGADAVYRGGLTVKTTIDLNLQRAAEKAIAELLPTGRTEDRNGVTMEYPQAALVSISAQTGQIKALVGGRGNDEFNRAIMAERSPGSAIKPFVYVAAIEKGFTPATIVVDEPLHYIQGDGSEWSPSNFNRTFLGPLRLREALERSTNTIAVKLTDQVTPEAVISYAKKMGITSLVESGSRNDRGLALALGGLTRGVTPLQMVEAYSPLANAGVRVTPYFIIEVRDANGMVLESHSPKRQLVLDDKTAYIITDMLKGVIKAPHGTGRSADIGRPAAGKTGTADSNTDAWFVGYTPDMITAVWIGEDTQREMRYANLGVVGSGRAAQIWAAYMKQALADLPPRDFPMPGGIVTGVKICKQSGELADTHCPAGDVIEEIFIAGTQPTAKCSVHAPKVPSFLENLLNFNFGFPEGDQQEEAGEEQQQSYQQDQQQDQRQNQQQ